jgi:hypothetical protein
MIRRIKDDSCVTKVLHRAVLRSNANFASSVDVRFAEDIPFAIDGIDGS